jgi:hypothetical protein
VSYLVFFSKEQTESHHVQFEGQKTVLQFNNKFLGSLKVKTHALQLNLEDEIGAFANTTGLVGQAKCGGVSSGLQVTADANRKRLGK